MLFLVLDWMDILGSRTDMGQNYLCNDIAAHNRYMASITEKKSNPGNRTQSRLQEPEEDRRYGTRIVF